MSKIKMSLEEAKKYLGSEKVFYNGKNKFNVVDGGKYHSGITIEVPQTWTKDKNKNPQSPFKYRKCRELTDGMNLDFDGDAEILLGNYRLSQNGRPVFEVSTPTKAKYVLIRVEWGGAFNRARGNFDSYAKEVGATFFRRSSSNGGGYGNDYWILPVDFVHNMDSRDVSGILQRLEDEDKKAEAEADKYIEEKELERKNSIENRERILAQINPIIQRIKEENPNFEFVSNEDTFTIKQKYHLDKIKKYSDDLVSELSNILKLLLKLRQGRETYKPKYQEVEKSVAHLGLTFTYEDNRILIYYPSGTYHSYEYTEKDYNYLLESLIKYQEELEKEKEETRRKEAMLKREAELKRQKEEAKKLGYPELFEFYNRVTGKTGQSHAYVIERNGVIREPDYNDLRNQNHRYHADWLNSADGTQGYKQILPGEVIVSYTKECTAKPYIFDIEWADGELTEAQIDTIYEKLDEAADFADTTDGEEITHLENWAKDTVKAKLPEFRKQLEDNKLAIELAALAEEKKAAQEKNAKAEELEEAYENQLDDKDAHNYGEDD